jgi:hypothetical protein
LKDSLTGSPVITGSNPHADSSISIVADSTVKETEKNIATPGRFITSTQNPTKLIQPKIIPQNTDAWLLGILISCFFAFTLIRFTEKKVFQDYFQAVRSLKPAMQNLKYNQGPSAIFIIFLFLLIVMVYSVFVIILIQKFKLLPLEPEDYSFGQFIIIPAIIGGLLIMQLLFTRLSGILFNSGKLAKKYTANSFEFNVISVIFLLPALMISLYDNSLVSIYLAIGVVSLLFIFRIIKGTFITLDERKYLLYHFFIYFCTLEILPILIIFKTILVVNVL